jgi:thiol-disulfide isomerase/thioredoxin
MTDPVPTASPDTSSATRNRLWLWLAIAVGAIAILGAVATGRSGEGGSAPGLAQIELATPSGGTATLADFEGKPLVVNFFASWCPPCRAELPDLEKIHQEFGDQITILGVNRDSSQSAWKAVVADNGLTYPTVFEGIDGRLFEAAGGVNMPTTLFIGPDGRIVDRVAGLQTASDFRRLISENFAE